MSYLPVRRYGLTRVEPPPSFHASWRQAWEHPSGMLAMRHPSAGYWVVFELDPARGWIAGSGWSSSLRAAALSIERRARAES